jgi:hypothetical protein
MKYIGIGALAIAGMALVAMLATLPVMWLWNDMMPWMFGLKTITAWQSFKLLMLCGILFNSSASSGSNS